MDEELYKAFVQAFGEASYQDRLVLHLRYEDNLSLEEIGKQLGISKERVRQIERQAILKLQKNGESLGLEDFLNE